MRKLVKICLLSVLAAASPFMAPNAVAGIKEVKFHFVRGQFEDYPVMEMKFTNGRWEWINRNQLFKPRMKVFFRVTGNKVSNAKVRLFEGQKIIWQLPAGYKTRKHEELVTLGIGKSILSRYQNLGKSVCNTAGGPKKVVKEVGLNARFKVIWNTDSRQDVAGMPMRIVCHANAGPTRNPLSAGHSLVKVKLTGLKLYPVPAKPRCGKPFKLVGEFRTDRAGTVKFMLLRGDGERQHLSIATKKQGNGYSQRWSKSYKIKTSVNRKYMLVASAHNKTSQWVPVRVNCAPGGSQLQN
ncbi:hypothetical protein [Hoeflea sp.]|uniref:hypothetical protein n=1 Tax=Hoeflea sp. TaxID=1940281 RepID=UPI003B01139A